MSALTVTLDTIQVGATYTYMVNRGDYRGATGRFASYEPAAALVIRKGAKKVRVRLDRGAELWVYPRELLPAT